MRAAAGRAGVVARANPEKNSSPDHDKCVGHFSSDGEKKIPKRPDNGMTFLGGLYSLLVQNFGTFTGH
jgi:hypothetical protein